MFPAQENPFPGIDNLPSRAIHDIMGLSPRPQIPELPVSRIFAVLIPTLLVGALFPVQEAGAETITFQVRMQYQMQSGAFDPDQDFVDLAGSFNGWGTDPLTTLSDADGDSIYEISLDRFTPGETIEFKFRINGQWDGSEEFPNGGANRVHIVGWGPETILVWYGDLEPVMPDPAQLGWWNDRVFYEIFVRSFQDSDGDGIGDLTGLTQRLDYLNDGDPNTDTDLGVTGIWLMPINDSPSYHGYDVTDYRGINPDYGTLEDLQTFLDAAHARGIKVIVDFVMNHCSNQHPWFLASAAQDPGFRDWFRWTDTNPGQDHWHWNASGWYYGLFNGGMPDLNYETPAVKAEMFDTATWWLETVGVDGFRLDAVLYILENGTQVANTQATFDFWQDFNTHIKGVSPDAFAVGEAWTNTATVLNYATEDRLDICFEFELAGSILGALNDGVSHYLENKVRSVYGLYPYLQFGTFLTNHDQDRTFTVLGEDSGKNRCAAGLYLSLPGVPFLYYGEEIGMTGSGDHLNIRTPMQWDATAGAGFTTGTPWRTVNANYPTHNVATMQADESSLWSSYRDMIQARGGSPALLRGDLEILDTGCPHVLAYLRRNAGETVLCVVNTSWLEPYNVTLMGSPETLPTGNLEVTSLLEDNAPYTFDVGPDNTLGFYRLDGYQVSWYRFNNLSAVPESGETPRRTGLRLESHPNPFNPSTTLRFQLDRATAGELAVFDAAGRRVRVLESGTFPAGPQEYVWDGRDQTGRQANSGLYLARLSVGNRDVTTKVLMVK